MAGGCSTHRYRYRIHGEIEARMFPGINTGFLILALDGLGPAPPGRR